MKARSVSRSDRRRWPLAPLLELYPGESITGLAVRLNVERRTVQRWKTAGLTDPVADEIATHVGLHPALIWPDWNADIDIAEPVAEIPRRPIKTAAPTPQPIKQETLMNPDDILDAYDQLKQLLTRVDRPTIDKLLDRLAGVSQAPVKRTTPKTKKKVTVARAPRGEQTTCSICGQKGDPRWLGTHLRSSHWDDVLATLDSEGAMGLVRAYGISTATAYTWRKSIERGVAA